MKLHLFLVETPTWFFYTHPKKITLGYTQKTFIIKKFISSVMYIRWKRNNNWHNAFMHHVSAFDSLDLQIQLDKSSSSSSNQNGKEARWLLFFCNGVRLLILLFCRANVCKPYGSYTPLVCCTALTFTPMCVCDVMHTLPLLGFLLLMHPSLLAGLYLAPCVKHTHTLHPVGLVWSMHPS
jgi:hypothetical protein